MKSYSLEELTESFVQLDEVRLHTVSLGPEDGELVIMLHGFPEYWYSWRHQLPFLASRGYKAVAVDLRGFNLSSKPQELSSYRSETVARDISQLVTSLGREDAHIVGHDWGSAVAWIFAMRYSAQLKSLSILNLPHPLRMVEGFKHWEQIKKSWYIGFFQLPFLPEKFLKYDNHWVLRWLMKNDPVQPDVFSEEDIEKFIHAFEGQDAWRSTIAYYRALRYEKLWSIEHRMEVIESPTLVLWGKQDRFLDHNFAEPPRHWVPNHQLFFHEEASHWLQQDQPQWVNEHLEKFLASIDA